MADYTKYLGEHVLAEDQVVTYRLLSRALKVHVNTSKQMLYDFHQSENSKKPGTVHATYLVYGTKNDRKPQTRTGEDGDVEMASSFPETDSIADIVPTYSLSLVAEEQLKDALADYEEVTSIHVYSVAPHPTKDSALLSDVAHKVAELQAADDSPATRRLYGTIPNSHVRRRERHGAGAVPSAAPVKQEAKPAVKAAPKAAPSEVKAPEEPKAAVAASASAAGKETPASSAASVPKPVPSLKRGGSSNSGIMQAFSKAAAKPKKAKASEPVDTPMSDDGEDDEKMPQARAPQEPSGRKSKKEREDELKRMMDDDDEEAEEEDAEEERPDSPVEEPAEEPTEEPQEAAPAKEEPKEIVSASTDGRKRGKRRVMKKKQVMDDQGYLVTIQEAGWESFSEEEAPSASAPKAKPAVSSAPMPAAPAKGKKAAAKTAQGNIMSFFSKK